MGARIEWHDERAERSSPMPPAPTTSSRDDVTLSSTPSPSTAAEASARDAIFSQRRGMAVDGVRERGDVHAAGHVIGNFSRYYAFNPVEERVRLLPPPSEWLPAAAQESGPALTVCARCRRAAARGAHCRQVLDLGCNAGDLGVAVCGRMLQAAPGLAGRGVRLLGLDCDRELVARAAAAAPPWGAAAVRLPARGGAGGVCSPLGAGVQLGRRDCAA